MPISGDQRMLVSKEADGFEVITARSSKSLPSKHSPTHPHHR